MDEWWKGRKKIVIEMKKIELEECVGGETNMNWGDINIMKM